MVITATSTPTLIAASAEPERARYRARSRSASRVAIGARRPSRASHREEEGREQDEPGDKEDDPEHELGRPATPAPVCPVLPRVAEEEEGGNEEDNARERRAVDLTGRRRPARERCDDRHLGDRSCRAGRGEEGRHDGEHHRGGDHDPREGEYSDDVVRCLFEARPVGEPDDEAEHEAEDRPDEADDHAVGTNDEADMAVGGAGRLEHADRAESALRQHGEAPTETSAMSSMPSTSAASEIVSGLRGFDWATVAGVCTLLPMEPATLLARRTAR